VRQKEKKARRPAGGSAGKREDDARKKQCKTINLRVRPERGERLNLEATTGLVLEKL